jgi:D-amino-acid dehydrogenase
VRLGHADVTVIGAGVIGAACALELAEAGLKVAVVDRGAVGHGCSYGNAGWITPCFALPLAMPGMMRKVVPWLLDGDSPLHIQPRASGALAWWLGRFLRSMNESSLRRSVAALTELSHYSLREYERLNEESRGSLELQRRGLLLVAATEDGLGYAVREKELVGEHGIPGEELGEREARELEPAVIGDIRGAVYFPQEAHVEPLKAVRALMGRAQSYGTRVFPNAEVFDFRTSGGRISALRTTRGWLETDHVVLAAGTWSRTLGRKLGLRIPVLGGKGYAAVVAPFAPAPHIPMMLVEKKIAVTPRDRSIRLAGTLELVDRDDGFSPRRFDAILRGAADYLAVPPDVEVREAWRGLRPCTPDGVPVIGKADSYANVTVATGHQMLGLQTAPATGRLVADLVLDRAPAFDPTPFRVRRFQPRKARALTHA